MADSAFPVVPGGRGGYGLVVSDAPSTTAARILSYVFNSFGGRGGIQAPGGSTGGGISRVRRLFGWLFGVVRRLAAAATRPLQALSTNQRHIVLFAAAYYVLTKLASDGDGDRKQRDEHSGTKVAVIGGGIAGLGTAWALHRSGFNVTVFEKKPTVGGNAKAHNWIVTKDDGSPQIVRTGLSVLAWPREFFHNYNLLMKELDIETVDHDLRFCVGVKPTARSEPELVYVHGRDSHTLENLPRGKLAWLATDLARWQRVVRFVRFVNGIFSPMDASGTKSLYVRACVGWSLCCRLFVEC